ncbi:MAG: hypothetical protein UU64_C0024G0007 [candidate division WWE3 bacterium GW2011_GWF2_41_45]|uniref:Uncharacterized protein n=1 Tax=candidate division WWE3 bacterium GW2011_GWC2_41_23 TaxID=1619123 RepID=A0A0G0VQP2_UNCKA|nr:MAG: hypothetical protein UU55_C0018G0002 [candidate division WWE3 bacterium GW2011_GWC2_41_23]KKS08599.1 MAG: hypothetical protein UU64_C0024G0007 [candidate division WWE3 bacterium GW2011_GWF2_41_45]HCT30309.1 hypothetical protein [Bacteroidales bacterium]
MNKSFKFLFILLVVGIAISFLYYRQKGKINISKSDSQEINTSATKSEICSDIITEMATDSGISKFNGTIKPINFNSLPDAKSFKTVIANSYKQGANFAGHYNLAFWGCGTDCFGMAITDLITGNIVEYSPVHEGYYLGGYEPDNRLIILNPVNAGMERQVYSLSESNIQNNVLELVCSEISQKDMYPQIIN